MAIKGFLVHDRESGAYTLTDSGRETLTALLQDAGRDRWNGDHYFSFFLK